MNHEIKPRQVLVSFCQILVKPNVVCHQTRSNTLKQTSFFHNCLYNFSEKKSSFVYWKRGFCKKTIKRWQALLNRDVLCAQINNSGREAVQCPHQDTVRFQERDSNLQSCILGWRNCSSLCLRGSPNSGPDPTDEVGRVSSRDCRFPGSAHRTSKTWCYRNARRIGLWSKAIFFVQIICPWKMTVLSGITCDCNLTKPYLTKVNIPWPNRSPDVAQSDVALPHPLTQTLAARFLISKVTFRPYSHTIFLHTTLQ